MSSYNIKSVKYNFLMNMLLTVTNLIFPLITFPYFSRILLPEGMGRIAFATAIVAYFTMIAQLGVPTYGIRICAQVRNNSVRLTRTVQELLIINFVMTAISYIVLVILIFEINRLYENRTLIIVCSASIALTSLGMNWLYSALEQYSFITVRSLLTKFISLVLMFLMVKSEDDYIFYALALVLATSGSSLLNIINARKYISFKPVGNYNLRQHIRPILTFFTVSVATSIYVNLDAVMLGFMTSDSEVGLYNAGIRINRILLALVTSLGVVMLPRLSYYLKNNLLIEFRTLTKKAVNFVFLIALPLVIYFIIFAKDAILFIAGESFIDAVRPMQILMPIILIVGISNITGIQMLVPMGAEKKLMVSVICGAIIDFTFNLILIPLYGASGAAISTLIAEIVVLIVQLIFLKEYLKDIVESLNWKSIIIIMLVSFVSLPIMHNFINPPLFLKLVITSLLYFIVYGLILLLLKEPLAYELLNIIKMLFLKIVKNKYLRGLINR